MRRSTKATSLSWVLLVCPTTFAASPDDAAPPELHIVVHPAQEELRGPDPFDDQSLLGFVELGMLSGTLGPIIAGAALDAALEHSSNDADRQAALTRVDRDFFDFRAAILDRVKEFGSDSAIRIAEIHEHDFSDTKSATIRWLHKNLGADHVVLIEPVYYISPMLDQARLVIDVQYYRAHRYTDLNDRVFRRKYEYLSPSRGELFRPWRAGEKAELIATVEVQFAQKSARYPKNRKAYEKDRSTAIDILERNDRILPGMALNEGWPGDALAREFQTATDRLMDLIKADLRDLSAQPPTQPTYVEFAALEPEGEPTRYSGYVIGAHDSQTVYRDQDGNVYSVPGAR